VHLRKSERLNVTFSVFFLFLLGVPAVHRFLLRFFSEQFYRFRGNFMSGLFGVAALQHCVTVSLLSSRLSLAFERTWDVLVTLR